MKTKLLLISILALSACSNQKKDIVAVESKGEVYALDDAAKDAVVKNDGKDKLVCTHRQKTGSHFKQKRCTTKSQRELDRKNAREILNDQQIRQNREYVGSKKG